MSTCAICASDIPANGKPRLRPLGKNDALVEICSGCDEEPAYERSGPFLGYNPTGSATDLKGHLVRFMDKAGIPKGKSTDGLYPSPSEPLYGHEVGTIPLKPDGAKRTITYRTAYKMAVAKWGPYIKRLAVTPAGYVFQYPKPKSPVQASHPPKDPLAPIAKYKRK